MWVGMNLHTNPDNVTYLETGIYNPSAYYANLDFSDLLTNAQWAKWIYDNPGFDTDGDGYAGKFSVCEGDTFWYAGDDVPDLKAAGIPVAPPLTAHGDQGSIVMHWNGWRTETTRDPFLGRSDFEGYNVFLKKHDSPEPYALVSSYDREDYTRVRYDQVVMDWRFESIPFTIEQLREKYAPGGINDSTWSPTDYTKASPLFWMSDIDSVFYFVPVGCNASKLGLETKIVKQFPDAPKPPYTRPTDVPPDEVDLYLNDQGQFKYYDYELRIDGLLTDQAYRVGVNSFDWGPGGEKFLPLSSPLSEVWPITPANPTCCNGKRGNIDCDPTNNCDIGDLTALVLYLFIDGNSLCCADAANMDMSAETTVDIADLSALVDQLFITMGPTPTCP